MSFRALIGETDPRENLVKYIRNLKYIVNAALLSFILLFLALFIYCFQSDALWANLAQPAQYFCDVSINVAMFLDLDMHQNMAYFSIGNGDDEEYDSGSDDLYLEEGGEDIYIDGGFDWRPETWGDVLREEYFEYVVDECDSAITGDMSVEVVEFLINEFIAERHAEWTIIWWEMFISPLKDLIIVVYTWFMDNYHEQVYDVCQYCLSLCQLTFLDVSIFLGWCDWFWQLGQGLYILLIYITF